MINRYEVYETNQMIAEENLDVRTITLGISLLDCIDSDLETLKKNIYEKITTTAKDLVSTGKVMLEGFNVDITPSAIHNQYVLICDDAPNKDALIDAFNSLD